MDCTKCIEIEKRIDKRLEKLEKGHELQSLEIEALKISGASAGEQFKTIFKTLDEIKCLIKEQNEHQKETLKIYSDTMNNNYTELRNAINSMRQEIETIKNKDDKLLADKTKKVISIFITVLITAISTGAVAVLFTLVKGAM